MAKSRGSFKKRKKELARKEKKDQKRQRKLDKKSYKISTVLESKRESISIEAA